MPSIEAKAYAKLNLTLDVLGQRADGYHDLRMIMQTVRLCDDLLVETATGGPVQVRTNLDYLPTGETNLAASAALALCRAAGVSLDGVTIAIQKAIPVCAGMGGGSADAAAVLRALDRLLGLDLGWRRLAEIGQAVGSDVPYCVLGGTALAEGRGEILTPGAVQARLRRLHPRAVPAHRQLPHPLPAGYGGDDRRPGGRGSPGGGPADVQRL